jgi:SAM-dependent methyltransferase
MGVYPLQPSIEWCAWLLRFASQKRVSMNLKHKIKKAFRLDTYTNGAALRNLNRIRWILKNASADIGTLLRTCLDSELRHRWLARKQTQKVGYILAQIDKQELDRVMQAYASGENSIWTKYLDTRKWIERSLQQVRRLGLVLNPPRDVLDLGCGTGYFLFAVKQLGARVLGVDLDSDPIFGEMIRLLGIERVGFAITRRNRLPEFGGRRFDLITAWMICFNNYDRADTIWVAEDWNFLLDDLSERLNPNGRIVFSMNEQLDGKFYGREIGDLFADRSDLMDGRVVIFTKARLDATARRTSNSGQIHSSGLPATALEGQPGPSAAAPYSSK